MIVSGTSDRSSSRWLRMCVLLCAMAVLPLGLAYAQEYDAVEKRLGEAVSEGELTLKQAAVMMDALRRSAANDGAGIGNQLKAVGTRLKAAVAEGELTEEEAWAKWHAFKERDLAPQLKAAVQTGGMSEEEARGIWGGIEKAEVGERLKAAVARGEMTEEEAHAKWVQINKEAGRDAGLKGHYRRMGVSEEAFDRLRSALKENGLQGEQIEHTLGGMLRVMHEMKSEGEHFELDPRMRDHFSNITLTGKQIEQVQELARRIVDGMRRGDEGDREMGIEGLYRRMGIGEETFDQIRRHLAEEGVKHGQIEPLMAGMLRIIHEMRSEGEDFELDPRLRNHFENHVRLTGAQIEFVQGVARRITHGLEHRGEGDRD